MDLLGVDVGGTKVALCIGDREGRIETQKRIETASLGKPEEGLPKLLAAAKELLGKRVIRGVGLALPGPLSLRDGKLIAPPNLPGWEGVAIADYFRRELGVPVFVNNDGNAAALAEWRFGNGGKNLVYLTLSTGVGGGIIVDGKLAIGGSDTAGEVGHFVLDPRGPKCPCGQRGCFEVYCGGKSVAARANCASMEEIAKGAREGDPKLSEVWGEFVERLAQGIGILLMTLNPDRIILGTIAVKTGEQLMAPLRAALPKYAWKIPLKHCIVEPSSLGDRVGLLGALAMVDTP